MNLDPKTRDPDLLWRYLLGDLTEQEQQYVEDELFNREEFLGDLASAEDDLIDSYVAGDLSPKQRRQFESHFLSSSRRKERLQAARALAAAPEWKAAQQPERKVVEFAAAPPRRRSVLQWMTPLAAAAAVILVAASTLIGVRALLSGQRAEVARLNQQIEQLKARQASSPAVDKEALLAELRLALGANPSTTTEPAARLDFLLSPAEARRDSARPEPRLVVPSPRHAIQLRLTTSLPAGRYTQYRAVVQTAEGSQVWGGVVSSTAGAIVLPLPAGVLRPGQYRVMLSGITSSGALEELEDYYLFQVAAR